MISVPVVIVGGGPVGMGLAMNIEALGVRSMILNAEPTPRWHPKGSTQNARTMEHYRRIGISRAIRKLGIDFDHPTDVTYFTRINSWELVRLRMPSEREKQIAIENAETCDQVPEPILRCNQMYVERFVYDHIQTLSLIDNRFGWTCVDWEQHADHVTVDLMEASTGQRETVSCAYLIGCDGSTSGVRRKLGIRYLGSGSQDRERVNEAMVTSYLRAPQFYSKIVRSISWHYWAINPERRASIVTLDGKGEFMMNSRLNSHDDKANQALVIDQFRRAVGQAIDVELVAYNPWTAGQALVADRYGEGRVLLAGDAVHLFTPTGGFGMNTGMDDAANLGWKLAATIQGWGGPNLLASYEIERRPIAFRNTNAARVMAQSSVEVPIGTDIEQISPQGAAERQAAADVLKTFGNQFASLGVQLGARYDNSPIVFGDANAAREDDPEVYVPTSQPGGRAPHAYLEGHVSLFDRLSRGFTLLCLADGLDASWFKQAADARGVPLEVLQISDQKIRHLYECDLALVRPDQHIAWRGNRVPADCGSVIAKVTGWAG